MNEELIKIEARLFVLEHILSISLAREFVIASGHGALDDLEAVRIHMTETIKTMGFPGRDAATSDLLSAEIEDASNRLLNSASFQISAILQAQRR